MKKNDWIFISKIMWEYSESHDGRMSILLKELIKKVNNNMEMIIDEMDTDEQDARINRHDATITTNIDDFERDTTFRL
tara:strand:+ start:814 stop:1047 length:234 start_codon:yes stop_codon:yes gene_type:complete